MMMPGSNVDEISYRDLLRQVLDSEYRRKKMMASRHIAISTWLEALHMLEYQHLFHLYGGVEDLIYASEAEIREVGIKNGAHRAKILSSLRVLRDKYEKGRVTGSGVLSLQKSPNTSIPNSPTGSLPPEFNHVIASPEKLQLDLQRELSGDPAELRSRPWYHGTISRQRAESLVSGANGDFLVRDCISRPGDFVLTCCWRGTPLNFMINAIVGVCAPGQLPPVTYRFEEEAFPTIQQLVDFYKTKCKPVTVVSEALLKNPVQRSMPLSYYDTKYGALASLAAVSASGVYGSTPVGSPKPSPFVTPTGSPNSSPEMNRRGVNWTGSQPVLNFTEEELESSAARHSSFAIRNGDSSSKPSRAPFLDRCDSVPIISVTPPIVGKPSHRPDYTASVKTTTFVSNSNYSSNQQHNSEILNERFPKPFTSHMRAGSAPALMPMEELDSLRQLHNNNNGVGKISDDSKALSGQKLPQSSRDRSASLAPSGVGRAAPFGGRLVSASSESELTNPPPPKPLRIPSVKYKQKPRVVIRRPVEEDEDDRDYSDYFQVREEPSWIHGNTDTAPKFREDPPKRLSPSPLAKTNSRGQSSNSSAPQMGRRANRLAREGKGPHSVTSSRTQPSQATSPAPSQSRTPSTLSSSSMSAPVLRNANHDNYSSFVSSHQAEKYKARREAKDLPSVVARVPPMHAPGGDTESPPMTPTYQIVVRSRSFQSPQNRDHINVSNNNNINNAKSKGYQTLPNRSSRSKIARPRKISDTTQMAVDENSSNDYDVPREHAIDDFPQMLSFQNDNLNVWGYRKVTQPPKYFPSAIKPEAFTSELLQKGHKALDQSVLLKVKKLLLGKSARDLAMTLTQYDLDLFKVTNCADLCMGVASGLELLTLPQGKQLRQDGLERWECLRLFVMVTLLACPTVSERAALLALWIQTCHELKGGASTGLGVGAPTSGAGNLFSFAAVMSGLCGESVRRLTDTWLILRQIHTSSAYMFDTRLRPAYSALNDASADLPVNRISVPYVTPVCRLLEASGPGVASTLSMKTKREKLTVITPSKNMSSDSIEDAGLGNSNNNNRCEYFWEAGLDPVGGAIDVLLTHLDTARVIAAQGPLYRSTAQSLMYSYMPEAVLQGVLSAEFHLLLLWGEKGWSVGRAERVDKLQQILTVLSNKYQVPGDDGTEV
ncbi:breast cancer anti-estrogen resistance protein 3-like isoform x2 [Plakobranchus ocellatus]|uniref:Breast cancer anti-estrogen resistance protein 3-like isoform x2 n=1 Tax=Plakobranchus ocellatus TaxID=259542 RepID=A0AAV3Z7P1_9GAST|nr:breast cancer anti-estrogen resistance protein 3-like isoform x2 [Plakobranchus ocellatus]